jgi:hypothetical protein
MIGFDGGGSKNSSLEAKRFLNDRLLHWKRKRKRNKYFLKGKTQGYMGELGLEKLQQPFPSNGARKLVGIS